MLRISARRMVYPNDKADTAKLYGEVTHWMEAMRTLCIIYGYEALSIKTL
jgi:hypothetical protein